MNIDPERVLTLLRDGKRIQWIGEAYNTARATIITLGLDNGLIVDTKTDTMRIPTPAAAVDPAVGPLLNETAKFADKTVQRLRKRIRDTMDELRARVALVAEEEETRAQVARDKADLLARKAKLRAELAAIDEKLRPGRKPSAVKPPPVASGRPPTAVVRAWALTNGVPCSPRGLIAQATFDAYLNAHEAVAS